MTERVVDGQLHGLTVERVCAALEWRLYLLRRSVAQRKQDHMLKEVQEILGEPGPHQCLDSEALFDRLQAGYPERTDYGYDRHATWQRAVMRVEKLLERPELRGEGLTMLEVGGGDGMVARVLTDYGHRVTIADADDWREPRARQVPLLQCDVCAAIPAENDSYDLVYSFATFEHVLDPGAALNEIVRVTRPGGLIYISANPLYWSPWGLHAFPCLRMPYPQMLFSRDFVDRKIRERGNYDLARQMRELQPLNEWRLDQYRQLWADRRLVLGSEALHRETQHLGLVREFPEAFKGLGLAVDDLTVSGFEVWLGKDGV